MEFKITGQFPLEKVLVDIGFVPKQDNFYFDFGNCMLTATKGVKYFDEIITFNGFYTTERHAGELNFELPLHVESFEQGLALLSYCVRGADFLIKPDWLENGMKLQDTLPWRKAMKAFNDKPNAIIESEWFSLLVKKLRKIGEESGSESLTSFSFDGEVLKIKSGGNLLAVPADGKGWNSEAEIESKALDILPKHVTKSGGNIYIWEERIVIGNRSIPLKLKQS